MEHTEIDIEKINIQALKRSIYRDSFFDFLKEFWPAVETHEFKSAPYIEYICSEIQKIFGWAADWSTQKDAYDLILNIAPGTTKSSIISKFGPAYVWTLNPDVQLISSAYSSIPVKEFTSKFKRLLNSDEFRKIYPGLKLIEDNVGKQKNNAKGTRYATSTGGSITGMHGDLLIYDDPNKPPSITRDAQGNPRLAQGATLTEIASANAWHDDVMSSRKTDKEFSRSIYVQQRVHRQDLSGYLLRKAQNGALTVKHICLPAELDPSLGEVQAFSRIYREGKVVEEINLKYLYTDNLLDPGRMPHKVLAEQRAVMGSYTYSAQYLERPSQDRGGMIRPEWFSAIDASEIPDNLVKYFYVDPSEGKTNSDNMAAICWSLWEGRIYVWEIIAVIKPFNEFIGYRDKGGKWIPKAYDLFVEKHGQTRQSKHIFEAKSSGSAYVQYMNANTEYIAVSDIPIGSKMDRVNLVSGSWEAGRIRFVKGLPNVNTSWIGETNEELTNFTGKDGDPDDRVDVLSAATKLTDLSGSSFIIDVVPEKAITEEEHSIVKNDKIDYSNITL